MSRCLRMLRRISLPRARIPPRASCTSSPYLAGSEPKPSPAPSLPPKAIPQPSSVHTPTRPVNHRLPRAHTAAHVSPAALTATPRSPLPQARIEATPPSLLHACCHSRQLAAAARPPWPHSGSALQPAVEASTSPAAAAMPWHAVAATRSRRCLTHADRCRLCRL
jgi:hypothetical protein